MRRLPVQQVCQSSPRAVIRKPGAHVVMSRQPALLAWLKSAAEEAMDQLPFCGMFPSPSTFMTSHICIDPSAIRWKTSGAMGKNASMQPHFAKSHIPPFAHIKARASAYFRQGALPSWHGSCGRPPRIATTRLAHHDGLAFVPGPNSRAGVHTSFGTVSPGPCVATESVNKSCCCPQKAGHGCLRSYLSCHGILVTSIMATIF